MSTMTERLRIACKANHLKTTGTQFELMARLCYGAPPARGSPSGSASAIAKKGKQATSSKNKAKPAAKVAKPKRMQAVVRLGAAE